MALKLYMLVDEEDPRAAFVRSFYDDTPAPAPGITRESVADVEVHCLRRATSEGRSTSRPFEYVDKSGSSLTVGAGVIGLKPTGGSITITDSVSGQTTGAILTTAEAVDIRNAIQAALTTNHAATTVTGNATGPYTITRGVNGAIGDLEVTATNLQPANSTAILTNTQDGTSGLPEQWFLELARALPVGRSSGWTTLPAAAVSITTHQAGDGTHNKIFKLAWNADAYGGTVTLAFLGAATTTTLAALAYNADEATVKAAFEAHAEVGANGVSVAKISNGLYYITCVGATIDLSNTPTLTSLGNSLQVPIGFAGTLNANTAGVSALLDGAESAEVTLEVRLDNQVKAVGAATIYANLIRATQGVASAIDPTLTESEMLAEWPILQPTHTGLRHADDATEMAALSPLAMGQLLYNEDTATYHSADGFFGGDWGGGFTFGGAISAELGLSSKDNHGLTLYASAGAFATIFLPAAAASVTITAPGATGTLSTLAGTETLSGKTLTAPKYTSYTVGTVPSAATAGASALIYVSNESGGAVHAFSDGTNWRRVTDRNIIS